MRRGGSSRFWPRNSHRFCSIARKEGPTCLHVCPVGRKITFLVATAKILPWPDCFVWLLHSGRTTSLLVPPLLFLAVKFWDRGVSNKTGSPSRSMIHSATRTSNERTLPPLYLVPRRFTTSFEAVLYFRISIHSIAQRSKSSKVHVVEEVDVN